ncbi:MAG: branched-chain amino acid ABC transporter permease [Anaerolineaceae bacterium]|jgi:branched-chain amino acid transport system permease protein|nr:MAG: branched-chain amino acid ABC transporter permease [Anaerolineaceae bacterium]
MGVPRPAGEFDTTYAYDMATIRRNWQWWLLIAFIVSLYALPFYASQSIVSLVNRIAITVIAIQGLNLLTGYTGQISLGQAAFMTTGGYISALLVNLAGWHFLAALPAAALGAGIVGLLFGLPSLRVKGFYLTMSTLAAQFIIPWFTRNIFPDILNGAQGVNVRVPFMFGIEFNSPQKYIYLSLTALVLTTIAAHNISRSRLGRAFIAIRDHDLAAELLGMNLFKYKLQAFFLAAVYAGIAGALAAHNIRHLNSETFNLNNSVMYLGMLVIGGLGSNLGPFFGAFVVEMLIEFATLFGPFFITLFPATAAGAVQALKPLFFGVTLMLFLIFEPRGLAHRWQLLKTAWRLRPFSH